MSDLEKQGQSYLPDRQTSSERQQYNNQNSTEEYSVNDKDANVAATKIQAQFRGHKTRRDLQQKKQKKKKSKNVDYPQSSNLNDEYSVNDKDANVAATKIQAQFRGHKTRRDLQQKKQEKETSIDFDYPQSPNLNDEYSVNDKDANVAATKIQAQFRGHKTRRDLQQKKQEKKTSIDYDEQDSGSDYPQSPNLNDEYSVNDKDANVAATKIQAQFRGHKTRRDLQQKKQEKKTSIDYDEQDSGSDYPQSPNLNDEYSVNDKDANVAATKIQAQFRGHKTRRDVEKMKQNKKSIDYDQQDSGFDYPQSPNLNDEYQKPSFDKQQSEEEKREQERAAIAIQAQFRGYQTRKTLRQTSSDKNESNQQEFDNNYDKMPISINFDDRYGLGENLTAQDDKNDDIDRSNLERESAQLGENLQKHTEISRNSNFTREQQEEFFNNEDDMNDPTLDKAATRIQASYRGYKTRKELGTGSVGNNSNPGLDQQLSPSISSEIHDEYDDTRNKNILSPSVEGNKVPAGEDDDNAAAVKIQAAYRGYRVRKDLEK